jgi:ABC-type glycerol-3-phosphate transport system permease component
MPLIWATFQSLRDSWEYSENGPLSLSFKSLTLGNWILAFDVFSIEIQQLGGGLKTVYIEKMFLNTILYAVGSSIAQISACVLVAYPVARFPYKFSKIIAF